LPIVSYDTDTGLGYGAKLFFLNCVGLKESFDLVLFNSTKGERWYKIVFSVPDFEMRQGTVYPLALDVTIDYDKWTKNSFFGIGNGSVFSDREFYTKEPVELSLLFSRGFTQQWVGQAGLRFRAVRNFGFSADSRLANLEPVLNRSRASYASLLLLWRFDTRDSYVNPANGWVVQGETELAPAIGLNDASFARYSFWVQRYSSLSGGKIILALRMGIQVLAGNKLPVQVLLPIGGNNTLRGSPQDRYLDKTAALCNFEIRFPMVWRIGGVVGADAGKVWRDISKTDLRRWATSPLAGLRLYMDTFVVRADVGFGKEITGFYLNFGHIF
jgi:outer membrane protein assembly factor BamA